MNNFEKEAKYLIQTYAKYPIELVKGEGSYVWDSTGKKYLDFYGGHAVCILGHCHTKIVKAINDQSKNLIFYSNVFSTAPAILLAEHLAKTLEPKEYQVYLTNSGSEANETALKIARKHTGKDRVISFKNAFHGRGIPPLAVTGIDSYHKYKPNLDNYTSFAELGDMESVYAAYNDNTAAVICEPIQSIGGLNMAEPSFYKELEEFCKEKNMLLIFDEIQTGLGRTGTFWFSEYLKVSPDIITTAKGIAGGLPLSAVIVKKEFSSEIKVGDHATTFGGGPVPCAAAVATLEIILKKGFLAEVSGKEQAIREKLKDNPRIIKIRGKGLLLGIELDNHYPNIVKECNAEGLIISTSSDKKVLRIMPPLIITQSQIDQFAEIFIRVLNRQ
jgi:predicted acetylornithine/succinylornithine family transaminase